MSNHLPHKIYMVVNYNHFMVHPFYVSEVKGYTNLRDALKELENPDHLSTLHVLYYKGNKKQGFYVHEIENESLDFYNCSYLFDFKRKENGNFSLWLHNSSEITQDYFFSKIFYDRYQSYLEDKKKEFQTMEDITEKALNIHQANTL